MRNVMKRILISTLILALALSFPSMTLHAETEKAKNLYCVVNGEDKGILRGLGVGYDNNDYVSLLDMQSALVGTEYAFYLDLSGGIINVVLEKDVNNITPDPEDEDFKMPSTELSDRALSGWSADEKSSFSNKAVSMNKLYFNGQIRKYYTILTKVSGEADCFIQVGDFCLLFDVDGRYDGQTVSVNTGNKMIAINPEELEKNGYFQGVNSVLVGDATTGEIFYGYNDEEVYPIASTTKLMAYLLVAEALQNGEAAQTDQVSISQEAADLSNTSDGVVPLKKGQKHPLKELICAALIASSNECDHAMCEAIYGDEESIVGRMNEKAIELSMVSAEFYNCNGLPVYTETLVPAKKQNRMSARDMFKLASHLLVYYPEIKDVTSVKKMKLNSLDKEIKNTNPVLYNMPEVTGLKTGTTNKSGACLVTSLTVNDGSVDHDLVVVLFGAEGSQDRGRVSELLARYAKAVVQGEASVVNKAEEGEEETILNAGSIINMIVNRAMQIKMAEQ